MSSTSMAMKARAAVATLRGWASRRRIRAFGALAALGLLVAAGPATAQSVELEPAVADLGELKYQETGTMEVQLRNTGSEPMRFARVVPSCSCVDGSVDQGIIAPGDAATLTVTMTAIKRSGVLNKKLWVWPENASRPVEVPVQCTIRDQSALVDADVEIVPNVVDMGVVSPQSDKTVMVELRNVGAGPVNFARASTSCGCVKARLLDDLTPAGDAARLEVTYEARPNVGPIRQEITVWRHGAAAPLKVPVRGEVSYPVRMDPFFVNLLSGMQGEILLESVDGSEFSIRSVDGVPPAESPGNEETARPLDTHVVEYDFTGVDVADMNPWFLIETDHPGAAILDLRVVHPQLLPPTDKEAAFFLSRDRFVLGELGIGASKEFSVDLLRLRTERDVESVSIEDPRLDAEIVETAMKGQSGVTLRIRVTANDGPADLVRTTIIFRAKDYEKTAPLFVRLTGGA